MYVIRNYKSNNTHTHAHAHTSKQLLHIAAHDDSDRSALHVLDDLMARTKGKESYVDLVVILLFICACLPFLIMTPVLNMTSTVPIENKIVNGLGLLIVVFLLFWSLAFRIISMIPSCKKRFSVPEMGDIGASGNKIISWHPDTHSPVVSQMRALHSLVLWTPQPNTLLSLIYINPPSLLVFHLM